MTYEEYAAAMDRLAREMDDSRLQEAVAKNKIKEATTLRHKTLKMEFHAAVNAASVECSVRCAEIHRAYAADRNRIWAQGRDLVHRYQQEHGITPPMGHCCRRAA